MTAVLLALGLAAGLSHLDRPGAPAPIQLATDPDARKDGDEDGVAAEDEDDDASGDAPSPSGDVSSLLGTSVSAGAVATLTGFPVPEDADEA